MTVAFGVGLRSQGVKAVWKISRYANELEPHPGEIMLSGRTYASNSAFVR